MDIYLNGQMLSPDQATVNVQDAGIQHAVGLFETLGVYNGRAFRPQPHLDRLAQSALELGLARQVQTQPLTQALERVIEHNQLTRARLRLTLTAGTLSMRSASSADDDGEHSAPVQPRQTLFIVPSEPTAYDPAYFEKGIRAVIYQQGANPFDQTAGHKTLSYWARLRSLRQAASVDAGEAIWLNVTNHLASGAISNVFLVKNGRLLTPIARGEEVEGALAAPVLPGITRAAVIELARDHDLEVEPMMLSVDDLVGAEEVFLTNSGWGLLPVTTVEKAQIASGQVGPITRMLSTALAQLIEDETRGQA